MNTAIHPAQRGAATLIVTLGLCFSMLLVAAFVNRNLIVEQAASAHQVRSTEAFEAAEAGLEWAMAQLNTLQHIGADCQPSNDPAASAFRERFLNYKRSNATFSVATWNASGVPTPLRAACVRAAGGWACSCPDSGLPVLSSPNASEPAPAFVVQFQADSQAGIVHLQSTGCTSLGGACVPGAASTADATARVEVTLGLLPGLKTAPVAVLTARGAIDAGAASLGLHNSDPASGGIAAHAGLAVAAPQARLSAPAGSPTTDSVVANDAVLAGLGADAFFVSYFGMRQSDWRHQSVVKTLRCDGGNCADALLAAIEPTIVQPLIHVAGDLRLDGPIVLGTPQRPVVVVVDGAAQLRGDVVVHGLIYSRALSWNDSAAGQLHGAAIAEGGYSGNGAPDLVYDADVLSTLKGNTGSFVRVNGSWRDF